MSWLVSSRLLSFMASTSAATTITLLTACVSVQVHPLTQQSYPPRPGGGPMALLQEEPARPHIKLAKIIATSRNASEETLRDRILERARGLGADAVVLSKIDTFESMGPGPLYESTLGPAGTYYSPFWGDWWSPFYLDPWSFVQGAADQRQLMMYVSGLAIRYEQGKTADASR